MWENNKNGKIWIVKKPYFFIQMYQKRPVKMEKYVNNLGQMQQFCNKMLDLGIIYLYNKQWYRRKEKCFLIKKAAFV